MTTVRKAAIFSGCLSILLATPLAGMLLGPSNAAVAATPSKTTVKYAKAVPKPTPTPAATPMTKPTGKSATATVSVNQGTDAELQKVKGIGPATAKKIISGRPYQKLDDLVTKKALTPAQFKTLKPNLSL